MRYRVLREDEHCCACCGSVDGPFVVDHIKPIRRYWGLRLERSNLQILCDDCNRGKGSSDETDWRDARFIVWDDSLTWDKIDPPDRLN